MISSLNFKKDELLKVHVMFFSWSLSKIVELNVVSWLSDVYHHSSLKV